MQISLPAALVQALSRLAAPPTTPAKPAGFSAYHPDQSPAQPQAKAAADFFDAEALADPKRLPTNGPIRRGMIVDILV